MDKKWEVTLYRQSHYREIRTVTVWAPPSMLPTPAGVGEMAIKLAEENEPEWGPGHVYSDDGQIDISTIREIEVSGHEQVAHEKEKENG